MQVEIQNHLGVNKIMEARSEAEESCRSTQKRLMYELIFETNEIEDVGPVVVYGIRITQTDDDGEQDVRDYPNISENADVVIRLMDEFEESGVDHITAMAIILDAVNF